MYTMVAFQSPKDKTIFLNLKYLSAIIQQTTN